MYKRYHKKVCFPEADKTRLEALTSQLNNKAWRYSSHCIDNIKYRAVNIEAMLKFIKAVELKHENLFEYYTDQKTDIIKVCYRIKYNDMHDLILVVSNEKVLVTIFLNATEDKHYTLNLDQYVRV